MSGFLKRVKRLCPQVTKAERELAAPGICGLGQTPEEAEANARANLAAHFLKKEPG